MTSSLNDSFLSVGDKSDLDIEFELCEELLEEDINESNEIVSNYFHELPSDINEVLLVENSNELGSENSNELGSENSKELCSENSKELCSENCKELCSENSKELCSENSKELCSENSKELCSENSKELCSENSKELCSENSKELCSENSMEKTSKDKVEDINNTHDLPSDSNVLDDDGFDSEVKKCYDILNVEKNDPDVLSLFCESDVESELNHNAEVPTEKIIEEDNESGFSETDLSTLEEFEISILESGNTPTIKQDISDKENYNDEEKDINDPGWELIKKLSTNEERYRHVKKSWESSVVPDPNRNLSYHSYRKRHFRNVKVVPKTRKRAATSNLDVSMLNPAKRQRSCTFLYDQNIDSLSAIKDKKERDIFNKMHCEVGQINNIFFEQEQRLQRQYGNGRHNYDAYGQMYNLRKNCQSEIEIVKQQYISKVNQCTAGLQYDINELSNARDEVLQFYSFYKSSNSSDPTILNTAQLRELDEIENIYSQFNKLYK